MNIEQTLETSYISLDYALLRVFVKDKSKYEDLLQLHKNVNLTYNNGDDTTIDMVTDEAKRKLFKVPDFVESISFSQDIAYENCILIMVLEGYDIMELHNWIQKIENL